MNAPTPNLQNEEEKNYEITLPEEYKEFECGRNLKLSSIFSSLDFDKDKLKFDYSKIKNNYFDSIKLSKWLKIYTTGSIFKLALEINENNKIILSTFDINTTKITEFTLFVLQRYDTSYSKKNYYFTTKIIFKDTYLLKLECNCDYRDIYWCSHIIASILFLIEDKEENSEKIINLDEFEKILNSNELKTNKILKDILFNKENLLDVLTKNIPESIRKQSKPFVITFDGTLICKMEGQISITNPINQLFITKDIYILKLCEAFFKYKTKTKSPVDDSITKYEESIAEKYKDYNKGLLKKDCCGCGCHKMLKNNKIYGYNVSCCICSTFHKKLDNKYLYQFVLISILEKIEVNIGYINSNTFELNNSAYLFFDIMDIFIKLNAYADKNFFYSSSGKTIINNLVTHILSKIFISTGLNQDLYQKTLSIQSKLSKIDFLKLINVGEESWYGKNILNIISGNLKDTKNFKEQIFVSQERFKILLKNECIYECLFYSSVCKNKKYIAISLALLDKVDESLNILKTISMYHKDAFEVTTTIFKKDKVKALEYFIEFLNDEKQYSEDELNWLIENCEKDNHRNEVLENLFANLHIEYDILMNIMDTMIKNDLIDTAYHTLINEFIKPKIKITSKIWKWLAGYIMSFSNVRAKEIVNKLIVNVDYCYPKIIEDIDPVIQILTKKELVDESISLSLHALKLLVRIMRRKEERNYNQILNSLKNFCRNITELIKKNNLLNIVCKNLLDTVSNIRDPNFLFELLQKIYSEENVNFCINYGKSILELALNISRKDPLIIEIIKWMTKISHENESKNNVNPENQVVKLSNTIAETVKKSAGVYAQAPLLEISEFLINNTQDNELEALNISVMAFNIDFDNDPKLLEKCKLYFKISLKQSKMISKKLALRILYTEPTLENFNVVSNLYEEKSPEWGKLRDSIIDKITKRNSKLNQKRNKSIDMSSNILNILIKEEVQYDKIFEFIKSECENFYSQKLILDFIRSLLVFISNMNIKDKHIFNDMWFCGIHYNIVIAILKGVTNKNIIDFISFVEENLPIFKLSIVESFLTGMNAVVVKKAKYASESNIESFIKELSDIKNVYKKFNSKKEWEKIIEEMEKVNEDKLWFIKGMNKWKKEESEMTDDIKV